MKISGRNQIEGEVAEMRKGATASRVRTDIGKGAIVAACKASSRPRSDVRAATLSAAERWSA